MTTTRDERHRRVIDKASDRVSFQLTYARSDIRRVFGDDGITGPAIADAFADTGNAPGDWSSGGALIRFNENDPVPSTEAVLEQFFTDAISEVVHEALEWFRIDGKCALDPHAVRTENDIYELCGEFAHKLWTLRGDA